MGFKTSKTFIFVDFIYRSPVVYFYGNPGDYWILDTDFTSFSSVYTCSTVGIARYELAFILTRDRFPTNSTVRKQA